MPIIRCTVAKDGKLIPTAVEFEPGDVIQFKSDQPVHVPGHKSTEIQLDRSLNLSNLIVEAGSSAGFQIDTDRAATGPRTPPPPPPGRIPTTVWVGLEKSIGGAAQRAGAGGGGGTGAE